MGWAGLASRKAPCWHVTHVSPAWAGGVQPAESKPPSCCLSEGFACPVCIGEASEMRCWAHWQAAAALHCAGHKMEQLGSQCFTDGKGQDVKYYLLLAAFFSSNSKQTMEGNGKCPCGNRTQHNTLQYPTCSPQTGNKTFDQGLSKPFDIHYPRISKGPRFCFCRRENGAGATCVQSSSWSFFPDMGQNKQWPGDQGVPGSSPAPLLSGWVPRACSTAWARH